MSGVSCESSNGVGVLTFQSPANLNALGAGMMEGIGAGLEQLIADPAVRCIIITGAGRGFCSGADLKGTSLADRRSTITESLQGTLSPLIMRLNTSPKPIVTAVNGPAAGAGVGLALAGDIVVAARSAMFFLSFARIGAVLDAGTSLFVQQRIGPARARALALLAEPLDATRAEAWGLVWRTVEDRDLMATARGIAERLAAGAPLTLGLIRRQLDRAADQDLGSVLADEASTQGQAFATADFLEGVTAYQERRAPRFTGR